MVEVIRLHAPTEAGRLVNCYVVDVGDGLVTVDSSLLAGDARAHRSAIDALGKPVVAALLTHGHPDHVVGLAPLLDGLDVPVYALASVTEVMRGYEPIYAQRSQAIPAEHRVERWLYPTQEVEGGETLQFGDVRLTVEDIGNGGDCRANSLWWLSEGGEQAGVFTGDLALRAHAWLLDGGLLDWIGNLERLLPRLSSAGTLYPGHLGPDDGSVLTAQREYLLAYVAAVKDLGGDRGALGDAQVKELQERLVGAYPGYPLAELVAEGAAVVAGQL